MPKLRNASRRFTRRTRLCWKSSNLAARRQSKKTGLAARREIVKTSAKCAWARGSSLPTGRQYPAESPCDALSVLDPAGNHRLPVESITPLSTVSVRTATVGGPNGRDEADQVVPVQVESLPRRRNFSANMQRDRVSLNRPDQVKTCRALRHLQARGVGILRTVHRNILHIRAKMLHDVRQGLHQNAVRRRPPKMLRSPLEPIHLRQLHLLRDTLPVLKAVVAVLAGSI